MRSLPPPKAGSILSGKTRAVPVMVAYDFDIQTYENHICKGGLALGPIDVYLLVAISLVGFLWFGFTEWKVTQVNESLILMNI